MPEYLGYQGRPEGVDWSGIADKAITGLDAIKKDREAQRAALEKSADDLVFASKQYKPGQSNVFNEKILQGADRVRANTLNLKKELMAGRITPTEYKTRVSKMSDDWKLVGDFAKSYNDIITKNTEYLNDPKSSALGAYMLEKQAGLSDLSDKNFVVDESGSIVLSDPKSGMVVDFMSMLNPENQTPEKVDLLGQVAGFTKNLGAVTGYDKGFWTKSAQLNPAYKTAKQNFAASLLKNPRAAASILADYVGDYEFYETEQQKKNIPAGKGIQLVMGPNGIATPKLTPEQLKAAQSVIEKQVDAEVDKLREKPEAVKYEAPSSAQITEGQKQQRYANRRQNLDVMFNDKTGKSATSYLKDLTYPGTKEKIEKVSFTPDGHVQFQTYSMRTTKRKQKNKDGRYEFVDVVEKVINPQLRAPLGDQAIGIMNQVLNTQGGEANIPIDFVYGASEFAPKVNAPQKKKPLPQ